jgi:hypothetical protein
MMNIAVNSRRSRAGLLWTLLAIALASVIAWRVPHAARAVQASREAHASLISCNQLADEVLSLRDADPVIAEASSQQSARLIHDVTTCLSRAGIASSAVTAVSPEGSRVEIFQNVRYQRIRARVTLNAVTLPQLGDFFAQWRVQQPRWIIDTVQLDPQPLDAKSLPQSAPDKVTLARPLNVTLTMESLALAAHNQP